MKFSLFFGIRDDFFLMFYGCQVILPILLNAINHAGPDSDRGSECSKGSSDVKQVQVLSCFFLELFPFVVMKSI